MSVFTDDDLKRLKEQLSDPLMDQDGHDKWVALLDRLEAAELIREYAGAPQHEKWLKADEAWRKSAGK